MRKTSNKLLERVEQLEREATRDNSEKLVLVLDGFYPLQLPDNVLTLRVVAVDPNTMQPSKNIKSRIIQ